jgi:hypothetical protein
MDREVMLLMGEPGVGKTLACLDTAFNHPDALFHYLKADRDPTKLFAHFDRPIDNLMSYDAFTFVEARNAIKAAMDISATDPLSNWIIVDTIGQLYKGAVDNYTLQVSGLSADDFISERWVTMQSKLEANGKVAKEDATLFNAQKFGGLSGPEWAIVKRYFYGDIIWPLIKSQCNVIMLCHPNNIAVYGNTTRPLPNVPDEVKGRFIERGVIPDLHKDVVRFVDTVLELRIGDAGDRYMYTIKETGVRNWLNEPTIFTHFWPDYSRLVLNG